MSERFEGIVLFQRSYREHDGLVKIFTDRYGTRMFFIRGMKRPNFRWSHQVQPLSLNQYVGRINPSGLSFLSDASSAQRLRQLEQDFTLMTYASYFAQLVDATAADGEPKPELYQHLKSMLLRMDQSEGADIVLIAAQLQLLVFYGIHLTWDRCYYCGRQDIALDFSVINQSVICQDHFDQDPYRLHLSNRSIRLAGQLTQIPLGQLGRVEVSYPTLQELRRLTSTLYEEYVGVHVKARRVLQQVYQQQDLIHR